MTNPTVKYPIGLQHFETLRKDGYLYVDKTALVHRLANEMKYVFLARPRRFGKSLLLSTLQAYFEGKKHIFKGLAISNLEQEWQTSPVFLLSLARYNRSEEGSLQSLLSTTFGEWERQYGIVAAPGSLSDRFRRIIQTAYEKSGQRVVVLVDEYDAPMVAHLGDEERHSQARDLLKSVYVNIKDMDQCIRFVMLTGVSRFSRTSIFSGLNNLMDITMDVEYSEICGITESELQTYFKIGIEKLADSIATDYTGALSVLKANYDGYHFTKKSVDIYNPFSVLNALSRSEIGSYWFASGTPTFLIEAIHNTDKFLPEYLSEEAGERTLSDIDAYQKSPLALMFQTGYLTIKGFDTEDRLYKLGLPNEEVRQGLSNGLLQIYMDQDADATDKVTRLIKRAFRGGEPEDALQHIKSFLAKIPYELAKGKDEIYFENNLYLLFNLIGINADAEYRTSNGRIDLLVQMPQYVYVMELKLDGTPQEAIAQINAKGYADQFATDPRTLYKIGINFSKETRNIDSWIIEQ